MPTSAADDKNLERDDLPYFTVHMGTPSSQPGGHGNPDPVLETIVILAGRGGEPYWDPSAVTSPYAQYLGKEVAGDKFRFEVRVFFVNAEIVDVAVASKVNKEWVDKFTDAHGRDSGQII